jgi:hypothetical protein
VFESFAMREQTCCEGNVNEHVDICNLFHCLKNGAKEP